MTDDSDAPTCPDCGFLVMPISPWRWQCRRLSCRKKSKRYKWVEEKEDGRRQEDQ